MRQSLEPERPAKAKPAGKAAKGGNGPMTLRMKILIGAAALLAIAVGGRMLWPRAEPAPEPEPAQAAESPSGQPAPTAHPHRTPEELPEGSGPTSRIGPGR